VGFLISRDACGARADPPPGTPPPHGDDPCPGGNTGVKNGASPCSRSGSGTEKHPTSAREGTAAGNRVARRPPRVPPCRPCHIARPENAISLPPLMVLIFHPRLLIVHLLILTRRFIRGEITNESSTGEAITPASSRRSNRPRKVLLCAFHTGE